MAKQNKQNSDFYEEQRTARDRAYYEQLNNPSYSEQATPAYAPITPNIDQSQVGPGSATFGQSGNNLDGTNASTDLANILGNIPKALEVASAAAVQYSENKDEESYAALQLEINAINEQEEEESVKIKKRTKAYEDKKEAFYLKENHKNIIQLTSDEKQKLQPALYGEFAVSYQTGLKEVLSRQYNSEAEKALALKIYRDNWNKSFVEDFGGNGPLEEAWRGETLAQKAAITAAEASSMEGDVNDALEKASLLVTSITTNAFTSSDEMVTQGNEALQKLESLKIQHANNPAFTLNLKREINNVKQGLATQIRNVSTATSSSELTQELVQIYELLPDLKLNRDMSHAELESVVDGHLKTLDRLDNDSLPAEDKNKIQSMRVQLQKATKLTVANINDADLRTKQMQIQNLMAIAQNDVNNSGGVHTTGSIEKLRVDIDSVLKDDGVTRTDDQIKELDLIRTGADTALDSLVRSVAIGGVEAQLVTIQNNHTNNVNAIAENGPNAPGRVPVETMRSQTAALLQYIQDDPDLTKEQKKLAKAEVTRLRNEIENLNIGRSGKIASTLELEIDVEVTKVVDSAPQGNEVERIEKIYTNYLKKIDDLDISDEDKTRLRARLDKRITTDKHIISQAAGKRMFQSIGAAFDEDDLSQRYSEHLLQDENWKMDPEEGFKNFIEWAVDPAGGDIVGLTPFLEGADNKLNDVDYDSALAYAMPLLKPLMQTAQKTGTRRANRERWSADTQYSLEQLNTYIKAYDIKDGIINSEDTKDESEQLVLSIQNRLENGNINKASEIRDVAGIIQEWAQLQTIRSRLAENPEEIHKKAIEWFLTELGDVPAETTDRIREQLKKRPVILDGDVKGSPYEFFDDIYVSNVTEGASINIPALVRSIRAWDRMSVAGRTDARETLITDLNLVMASELNMSMSDIGKGVRAVIGEDLPESTVDELLKRVEEFFADSIDGGTLTSTNLPYLVEDLTNELINATSEEGPKIFWNQSLRQSTKTSKVLLTVQDLVTKVLSSEKMAILLELRDFTESGIYVEDIPSRQMEFADYDYVTRIDDLGNLYKEHSSHVGPESEARFSLELPPTPGEILSSIISKETTWNQKAPVQFGVTKKISRFLINESESVIARREQGSRLINSMVTDPNLSFALSTLDNEATVMNRLNALVKSVFPNMSAEKSKSIAMHMRSSISLVDSVTKDTDKAALGAQLEGNQLRINRLVEDHVVSFDVAPRFRSLATLPDGTAKIKATSSAEFQADQVLSKATVETFYTQLDRLFPLGDQGETVNALLADLSGDITWEDVKSVVAGIGHQLVEHDVAKGGTFTSTKDYYFELTPLENKINEEDIEDTPLFILGGEGKVQGSFSADFSGDDGSLPHMLSHLRIVRGSDERVDVSVDTLEKLFLAVPQTSGEGLGELAQLTVKYIKERDKYVKRIQNWIAGGSSYNLYPDPTLDELIENKTGDRIHPKDMFWEVNRDRNSTVMRFRQLSSSELPDAYKNLRDALASMGIPDSNMNEAATIINSLFNDGYSIDGSAKTAESSVPLRNMILLHQRLMDPDQDLSIKSFKPRFKGPSTSPNVESFLRDGIVQYRTQDATDDNVEIPSWIYNPRGSTTFTYFNASR